MLVALEGLDGAGKQTQAALLRDEARAHQLSAEIVSFPRYERTVFSQAVADYLNGGFGRPDAIVPHFPALLYAGDRFEGRHDIARLAAANDLLVLDRYVASNFAYQGAKIASERREDFLTWLSTIEHTVFGLPRAALTVYLRIPAALARDLVARKAERRYTRRTLDVHEADADYLARCARVYDGLAERQYLSAWRVVDCVAAGGQMKSPEDIGRRVWEEVSGALASGLLGDRAGDA